MQALYICFIGVLAASLAVGQLQASKKDDTLERVKKIVANARKYVSANHLRSIPVPDLSYDHGFSTGNITNAYFSDLATLAVVGKHQVLKRSNHHHDLVYHFELTLGLEKFILGFDFHYRFFELVGSGQVQVLAKNNTALLKGKLTRRHDGHCSGVLESAVFTQLGDYVTDIEPKTLLNALVSALVEFAKNSYLSHDLPTFNKVLSEELKSKPFQKKFSALACKSFV